MAENVISFSPFFGFLVVFAIFSNSVDVVTSQWECPGLSYKETIGYNTGIEGFKCGSDAQCTTPCSKTIPEDKVVATKCYEANLGSVGWVYNCDCCFEKTPLDFCKDGELKNLGLIETDFMNPATSSCSTNAECETQCAARGVVPDGKTLNGAICYTYRLFNRVDLPQASHCVCCLN